MLKGLLLVWAVALFADTPRWQLDDVDQGWSSDQVVLKYHHHSELQRQWAWELMGRYPLRGDERILDFGSGDGKITAEISHFLPEGEIVGADISEQMVTLASRLFPTAYYPKLSFAKIHDLVFGDADVDGKFDRIYSFCVFHLAADPQTILINLRGRLKEGGTLLMVYPNGKNSAYFSSAQMTFEEYGLTPPWAGGTRSGPTMRTLEGSREISEAAGWKIDLLEERSTPFVFANKAEFVEWCVGTLSANWAIDLEIAEEFFSSQIDHMIEIDPSIVDEYGAIHFGLSRIHLVARSGPMRSG